MPTLFKAVTPTLPKVAKFRGYILNAMLASADDVMSDLEKTTATWTHKVTFVRHLGYKYGDVYVICDTDDEVWNYLDKGTSVRHAVMTRGFVPKTKVGWIGSQAGKGGKDYVSKNIHLKGIDARLWSMKIRMQRQKGFERRVQNAVVKGLQP